MTMPNPTAEKALHELLEDRPDSVVKTAMAARKAVFKIAGDPQTLLEGTGKRIRHVRLENASDMKRPEIIALIHGAVQQGLEMAVASKTGRVAATVVVKRRKNNT